MKKKIILGTANFSGNYGIFNKQLKKNINIKKILKFFNKNKFSKIDISPHYFNLKKNEKIFKDFKIIYKILLKKNLTIPELNNEIKFSKNFMKRNEIYCLMFHNTEIIKDKKKITHVINYVKEKLKIKKIGISVYSPNEVRRVMKFFKPDLIQFPINVFDQTFLKKNFLFRLRKKGIELHARSIFLQGLLLQKEYPSFLHKDLKKHWQIWNNWLNENNISPLGACISFINKIKHLDGVIIGIETLKQLNLILNLKVKKLNFDKLAIKKKKIIYPQNWLQK